MMDMNDMVKKIFELFFINFYFFVWGFSMDIFGRKSANIINILFKGIKLKQFKMQQELSFWSL